MLDVITLVDIDALAKFSELAMPVASVCGLGWWLRGKFEQVDNRSEQRWLTHEGADNARHLENLERFRRMGNALVSLGFKNGNSLEPH